MRIPFNKPFLTGREFEFIKEAYDEGWLASNGLFTQKTQGWLERSTGSRRAYLTHSCTTALEIAALLIDIQPGDEVIMPSFTFVSTANAFALRGGVPVFVDVREDTLNIDEAKIEPAITPRTKAIVLTHYAGVGCEMEAILAIARKHNLVIIEDAAHSLLSFYRDKPLGSFGHLAALSFHETKNIIAGEGGALLINDPQFLHQADLILNKGTNRSDFEQGLVEKYSWCELGGSYRPSELVAAFLWAQMQEAGQITERRLSLWQTYHERLQTVSDDLRLPFVPAHCRHNAHMYYSLLPNRTQRDFFLKTLNDKEIGAVFHYTPLHNSTAGLKYGRTSGSLNITENISQRLVRLPLWIGLETHMTEVISEVKKALVFTAPSAA